MSEDSYVPLVKQLLAEGHHLAPAIVGAFRELAGERDKLLTALHPFALAHKKLEMMPHCFRYSFKQAELAAARVAVSKVCGIDWKPETQKEPA